LAHLEIVDLREAEDDYVALSYVWGDLTKTRPIILAGTVMQVTSNLHEALQGLRNATTPMRLWADAICINQKNLQEKYEQVKRMGIIYSQAKQVVIWLGRDDADIASDCFDLIRSTNNYLGQQLVTHGAWVNIPTLVRPYPICDDPPRWDKVRKMLTLSWFTRVWVIQEAGLAKRCTCRWGNAELEFAHIMELAMWQLHREDVSEVTGPLQLMRFWNQFRGIYCTFNSAVTWRDDPHDSEREEFDRSGFCRPPLRCLRDKCLRQERSHLCLLGQPSRSRRRWKVAGGA
jgi:hypothetical protein